MADPEVYLFTGPEIGERNDEISSLKEASRKKNGAIDEYSYYASESRFCDVIAQLRNESLFSSATFVVVKNAELIKLKDDIDLLESWVKAAKDSPNTLVLVSEENSVDKKVEKLIPVSHKKMFWEMFEDRKPQWVQNFFKKNGFSVTPDAVESILDMVENNTEELKSECSRFFYCFEKSHTITSDDVDNILSHNREESAFTLFEAMADSSSSPVQRLESSMQILQKIRLSRDSNAVSLIAGLAYCFRQLNVWHSIHSNGAYPSDTDLRNCGFAGKKNQERYKLASRVWGPGATSSIIALLSSTDMSNRESGTAMEDTRLVMMIYSIVIKNGVYCSTYDKN